MAFELHEVVPWGRNMDEYCRMFNLTSADLSKRIISFGDGPASFNAEMTKKNRSVVSLDPVYQYSRLQLHQRILETKIIVLKQASVNYDNFNWNKIKTVEELETIRMDAMNIFLDDFEKGKKEGRYITHAMPEKTHFRENEFEIALSSHFLLLYSQLGSTFHLDTILEMLRVAKEVRIFPIVDLNGALSPFLEEILQYFKKEYSIGLQKVEYHFQKNANEMLVIKIK